MSALFAMSALLVAILSALVAMSALLVAIAALFASILWPWLSKRAFWRTCLLRVSVIREAFLSISLRFSATASWVPAKFSSKSFTALPRFVTASSVAFASSPIAALFASILSPWLSKRAFWRACFYNSWCIFLYIGLI